MNSLVNMLFKWECRKITVIPSFGSSEDTPLYKMPYIEFDAYLTRLKQRIPIKPDSFDVNRQFTKWFKRFKHDRVGDRTKLQASDIECNSVSFRISYTIEDKRVYMLRESLWDTVCGNSDPERRQKTTYNYLVKFEPMAKSSIFLCQAQLKPYVDLLVFKRLLSEKDLEHGRRMPSILRSDRIHSAIANLEQTIVSRGQHFFLTDEYAKELTIRYGKK